MMSAKLQLLNHIPEGLINCSSSSLTDLFSGPTLIHLEGKQLAPLFISVMLHGNEPTGLLAVQELLKKYQHRELPRSLSIFFGNIEAASQGMRRLDGQADYNRIWPGSPLEQCAETEMAQQIVTIMAKKGVFASIDIHNNTGLNPHYSCINRLDPQFLQLATLFGRFVVYFTRPQGVQSLAFARYCPSVTLECGRPGQQYGVEHAFEFIDSCLNLTEIPEHDIHHQDIDLFHTVAQVNIKEGTNFSFHHHNADLVLNRDIESLNFTEISEGTRFGKLNRNHLIPLLAKNEHGEDVTDRFFTYDDGYLAIKRATMPSMLTLDEKVIKQDCLCYLMERINF